MSADADAKNKPASVLAAIHSDINQCRVCANHVSGFQKPPHLERGDAGPLMIVGQGPGKAELKGNRAFAGQSGKTLDGWLISAGASERHPRHGAYFTSVIKCCHSRPSDFQLMAHKCEPFLLRQIKAIQPRLIITLGKEAYLSLRFTDAGYEEALCTPVRTSEYLLVSQFAFHFWLLPWPHPSGLNRWHNSAQNRERLRHSFTFIRELLGGGKS